MDRIRLQAPLLLVASLLLVPGSAAASATMDQSPSTRPAEAVPPQQAGKSPVLRKSRFATAEEMPVTAPDQDVGRDTCLRFTGSRLLRDDRASQRCAIASGRVYYNSDIDQATAGSLADVLRR